MLPTFFLWLDQSFRDLNFSCLILVHFSVVHCVIKQVKPIAAELSPLFLVGPSFWGNIKLIASG